MTNKSNQFVEDPVLFVSGYCDSLALVLSEKTGWKLGAIVRMMQEEDTNLFTGEPETRLVPFAAHAVLTYSPPSQVFDLRHPKDGKRRGF